MRSMDVGYEIVLVMNQLETEVSEKEYVYVGVGAEFRLGTNNHRLRCALGLLKEHGDYKTHYIRVDEAAVKVLTASDKTYLDVYRNKDRIF